MARGRDEDDDYDDPPRRRDRYADDDEYDRPRRRDRDEDDDGYDEPPPPNHLVPAILTTLLCCTPLGVVAVVYAAQVSSKWSAGDGDGAWQASRLAKQWCWLSFGFGFVAVVLWVAAEIALAA